METKEKSGIIAKRDSDIRRAVELGFISGADAIKVVDKLNGNWAIAQAEHMIITDPATALKLLEKKAFPNLDEENRQKLTKHFLSGLS